MRRCALLILFLLGALSAFGQQIELVQLRLLPLEDHSFMRPQFSPDGKQLLLTQSGFKGLWLYDLREESLAQLNDLSGAGYEPQFSRDGSAVIFRTDEYINKRRYSALAIQKTDRREPTFLTEMERHLSPALLVSNDDFMYRVDENIKTVQFTENALLKPTVKENIYGYVENSRIIIYDGENRNILKPFTDRDYIWFSLSPDKTQFVFTVLGGHTYIADLEGNIQADLGRANAPEWSPDGNWIVYMDDRDDGHVITSSDIWVYNLKNETKIQLTRTTDRHEMYPVWSSAMDQIACAQTNGRIAILDLQINE